MVSKAKDSGYGDDGLKGDVEPLSTIVATAAMTSKSLPQSLHKQVPPERVGVEYREEADATPCELVGEYRRNSNSASTNGSKVKVQKERASEIASSSWDSIQFSSKELTTYNEVYKIKNEMIELVDAHEADIMKDSLTVSASILTANPLRSEADKMIDRTELEGKMLALKKSTSNDYAHKYTNGLREVVSEARDEVEQREAPPVEQPSFISSFVDTLSLSACGNFQSVVDSIFSVASKVSETAMQDGEAAVTSIPGEERGGKLAVDTTQPITNDEKSTLLAETDFMQLEKSESKETFLSSPPLDTVISDPNHNLDTSLCKEAMGMTQYITSGSQDVAEKDKTSPDKEVNTSPTLEDSKTSLEQDITTVANANIDVKEAEKGHKKPVPTPTPTHAATIESRFHTVASLIRGSSGGENGSSTAMDGSRDAAISFTAPIPSTVRLRLYGYYKCAISSTQTNSEGAGGTETEGVGKFSTTVDPSSLPRPSLIDPIGKAKRDVWIACHHECNGDALVAMGRYVDLASEMVPGVARWIKAEAGCETKVENGDTDKQGETNDREIFKTILFEATSKSTVIEAPSGSKKMRFSLKKLYKKAKIGPRSTTSDKPSRLIHKGRSVNMIKRMNSIEGLGLLTRWTPPATEMLKAAIEAVVRANPLLAGKLVEVKKPRALRVILDAFDPKSHSFVTTIDPPHGMISPQDVIAKEGSNTQDLFQHVHTTLAPFLLGKATVSMKQIKDESPLFAAKIMDFGDGSAAFTVKMSHALGDGSTFLQVVGQISSYMMGNTPSEIDWDNAMKSTHEIYPETFSERDYNRSYGLPFLLGVAKNLRTLSKRSCNHILLSKDKIDKKKKELQQTTTGALNISTNDVIMSCLCEMCGSSDILSFNRSVRGIKEGVSKTAAGNFFWEIPFEREKGTSPFVIRQILVTGSYFATNNIPLKPFLNGRVGRITSLSGISQQSGLPGYLPSASFIKDLPLDVAIIFPFDKDHLGIMHNFMKVNPSPLLEDILA